MKSRGPFLLPLAVLALCSCGKPPAPVPLPEHPAPTLHLPRNEEELLRIAEDARETLPLFFRHLQNPAKGEADFRVKYPFQADSGSGFSMEQIWLEDIRFTGSEYYGALANAPFYIAALRMGDSVSFSPDKITDWMYTQNGTIAGGRSIKYLLEQIPGHERSEEQRAILQLFPD
jgi:uncharacterized protein YegJ (DUF2314 family)